MTAMIIAHLIEEILTLYAIQLLILAVIRKRQQARQKRKRKLCESVRKIFHNRESLGTYHTLVQELTTHREWHYRYTRMSSERFNNLLSLITKKPCRSRSPFSHAEKLMVDFEIPLHWGRPGDHLFTLSLGTVNCLKDIAWDSRTKDLDSLTRGLYQTAIHHPGPYLTDIAKKVLWRMELSYLHRSDRWEAYHDVLFKKCRISLFSLHWRVSQYCFFSKVWFKLLFYICGHWSLW